MTKHPWQCGAICTALAPAMSCACFERGHSAEERIARLDTEPSRLADQPLPPSENYKPGATDSFKHGSYTFHFVGYVIHHHEANCRCGSVMHWTTLYRAFASHNAISISKRLFPCETLPPDSPVVAFQMPATQVPLCAHCLRSRKELIVLQTDDRAWNEAIRQVIQSKQLALGEAAKEKRQASGKPLPVVDLVNADF